MQNINKNKKIIVVDSSSCLVYTNGSQKFEEGI